MRSRGCRSWDRTDGVSALVLNNRGVEGKEKGKGVSGCGAWRKSNPVRLDDLIISDLYKLQEAVEG